MSFTTNRLLYVGAFVLLAFCFHKIKVNILHNINIIFAFHI